MSSREEKQKEQPDLRALLEASVPDPERLALRREALETMPREDLAEEMSAATVRLHERLSKDSRAIHVSDPTFSRDKYQVTLPLGQSGESITIQSNQMVETRIRPTIEIYTGEASAELEANPTDIHKRNPAQRLHGALRSHTRSELHFGREGFSLRDMQEDVADILFLEALAEQFTPASAPDTVAQVGATAVHAGEN